MQRRQEQQNREKIAEERDKRVEVNCMTGLRFSNRLTDHQDAHWVVGTGPAVAAAVSVQEGAPAKAEFRPGRRSFGNFNPLVEKLVKKVQEEAEAADAEEDAIDDQQFADKYGAYTGLPGKGRPSKKKSKSENAPTSAASMREQHSSQGPHTDSNTRARAQAFLEQLSGEDTSGTKRKASSPPSEPERTHKKQFLKPVNPKI